jgi:hypothetical protein
MSLIWSPMKSRSVFASGNCIVAPALQQGGEYCSTFFVYFTPFPRIVFSPCNIC